ncbi:MAG: translation initiation factor IF-2 [Candidatus Omnitrophota bacterium]
MGIRVYELAKELKLTSRELISKLHALHVNVKGHMSSLDEETAEIIRHEFAPVAAEKEPKKEEAEKLKILQLKIPCTVKELSVKLQVATSELIKRLIKQKIMATINQNLDEEILKRIGMEFGYKIEKLPSPEEVLVAEHNLADKEGELKFRSPVVTLMGHVDHGKTSLLDAIRNSKITTYEAGGITQHIGAYKVHLDKGEVTFLDTPGHEAFTAMRARGAVATDVVVLVVAADDGIMPQTDEAIDHARAAGVPIVVAINKVDLPSANVERVKKQLMERNLSPEDWGGKTIMVEVSAKTGQGIDNLLELLLLEAEMLELKANPARPAKGVIIEGKITKGGGPQATLLVQNGSLIVGDVLVCGKCFGKIRAMINDRGQRVEIAKPSDPVEILGINGVPLAGELFYVVSDEKKAREIVGQKSEKEREETLKGGLKRITLEELYSQVKTGTVKELKLIAKVDVQGSIEALKHSLEKLTHPEISLNIIHAQVGSINVSDIMLAAASNAIVIGFHVNIEPLAKQEAERQNVDLRFYRIIYEVVNDIRMSMEGLLEPKLKEVFVGRAAVQQVFKITKFGNIAGCIVTKGKIIRQGVVKLYRGKDCLYEGKIATLKRFKDDVREVPENTECGIGLVDFIDIAQYDIIDCFVIERHEKKIV